MHDGEPEVTYGPLERDINLPEEDDEADTFTPISIDPALDVSDVDTPDTPGVPLPPPPPVEDYVEMADRDDICPHVKGIFTRNVVARWILTKGAELWQWERTMFGPKKKTK